ncbi:MAG: hypothetical protein LBT59_22925, partial [Clostridiales bacterium]|nr:hypothetical protein [Clostridiales bacterium]
MTFKLPAYVAPDFKEPLFANAPDVKFAPAEIDGAAPLNFHATSIFPEYYKVNGEWKLAIESRMDCVVSLRDEALAVVEPRNLKKGDLVALGRTENCEDGIFLHSNPFLSDSSEREIFGFRHGRSRETAFSMDYDNLYSLLRHEKENGFILWVMGPAFAFDYDARRAMQALADAGFVNGLLAGNALATHDMEAGYFKTALGQDIYTQQAVRNGHYHHLDLINRVRLAGSIEAFLEESNASNGIMYSLVKNNIPYVLTGSIRDDGPLPGV